MLAALYAAALAYLSLIPFKFKPQPLAEAWGRFSEIPLLSLGLLDRADWIANLVAYAPFGLLLAAALDVRGRRAVAIVAATAIALVFAVAIEFLQLFFAPRTVSLNDLLAELIGALAGASAWPVLKDRLNEWARELMAGGGRAARAVLWAYAVAYVLISLFPYDFVTNAGELAWKLGSDSYGLLFAPGQCGAFIGCSIMLGAEALAAAPFGWLLASYATAQRARIGTGLAVGAILGLLLEGAQFLLASGRSQGVSVITRAAGVALGVVARKHLRAIGVDGAVRWGRILSIVGLPLYLLVLAFASGWFGATPIGIHAALVRLPGFNYLPFYHHYFVSEPHAVASTVAYVALYAPVGVGAWLWLRWHPAGAAFAVLGACVLALVAEFSKALLPGKHPDVTDVLIAGVSAWTAFKALQLGTSPERKTPLDRAHAEAGHAQPQDAGSRSAVGRRAAAVVLWATVAWSVLEFPMLGLPLAAGLVAYAALLVWRPQAWLVVLPALLPVLDLAPWSGRFYWDELDVLLATTVGVRLLLDRPAPAAAGAIRLPSGLIALFALSAMISTGIGLWPLQPMDANAFASYLSHYNALRLLKPVAWGFALLVLTVHDVREDRDPLRSLALGMAIGAGLAAAGLAWERWLFPGLFDFSTDFRASGTFSAMHTGGADAEGYLVAAVPFVALQVMRARRLASRAVWLFVLMLAVYGVFVTFSRGGIAGLAVGLGLFALLSVARDFPRGRAPTATAGKLGWTLAGVGVLALVAVPVLGGRYLSERLSQTGTDVAVRVSHWRDALSMMSSDAKTLAFGMGLGRFPEAYFWGNRKGEWPPGYRFERDRGEHGLVLRLTGGYGLYFEHRVGVVSGQRYRLSFDARGSSGNPELAVRLCERSLNYSGNCKSHAMTLDGAWRHYSIEIPSDSIGSAGLLPGRPVALILQNPTSRSVVDVDNVSLTDASHLELVRNGDFRDGMDFWFFSSDEHLPWHIHSLPVHVFFEQGLVGLAALALLILCAIRRLAPASAVDPTRSALLASLAGYLVVGLFSSLVDTSRLMLLLLMLVFAAVTSVGDARGPRSS